MLTKEPPHLAGCIPAPARGPDYPFRQRLAARPGVASSLDGIEHHGRVFSAVRVFEAGDIPSGSGFYGGSSRPVFFRPNRPPTPQRPKPPGGGRISPWSRL